MSAPPPPPYVTASFLDPDGISSLKALSDASITAPPDALVYLLIAPGLLSVIQSQGQYGFILTAKQASKFGLSELNRLSPVPVGIINPGDLKFQTWNDPILPWEVCSAMIRTESVSGILVVVRHWNSLSSKYGSPILRLVDAPSLETFPTASIGASGLVLLDIWDPIPESLAKFRVTSPVTPVLVLSGGFPRPLNTLTLSSILESVQGLVLHSVEDLVTPISLPSGYKHILCWMFPAGTNLPIGLAWKLSPDLTLDKFI